MIIRLALVGSILIKEILLRDTAFVDEDAEKYVLDELNQSAAETECMAPTAVTKAKN